MRKGIKIKKRPSKTNRKASEAENHGNNYHSSSFLLT